MGAFHWNDRTVENIWLNARTIADYAKEYNERVTTERHYDRNIKGIQLDVRRIEMIAGSAEALYRERTTGTRNYDSAELKNAEKELEAALKYLMTQDHHLRGFIAGSKPHVFQDWTHLVSTIESRVAPALPVTRLAPVVERFPHLPAPVSGQHTEVVISRTVQPTVHHVPPVVHHTPPVIHHPQPVVPIYHSRVGVHQFPPSFVGVSHHQPASYSTVAVSAWRQTSP